MYPNTHMWYCDEVKRLLNKYIETKSDADLKALDDFQYDQMRKVLDDYYINRINNEAQGICYKLLSGAVHESITGNYIVWVDKKELADEVDAIIWEEIGEYMLDSPEIYEQDGKWAIDCMFAGNYVPGWDGWELEVWK